MEFSYFRAGVGTVIYNTEGKVAWFRRVAHPADVWQFQQGGIDPGESPEETLWRELYEETGVTQDDIERVDEYPHWLSYTYEPGMVDKEHPGRLGQTHRWYFLKLKDGHVIDLDKAPRNEFDDHTWTTFEEVINATRNLKRPVYEQLYKYFKTL